jgi:hypothetical protein
MGEARRIGAEEDHRCCHLRVEEDRRNEEDHQKKKVDLHRLI